MRHKCKTHRLISLQGDRWRVTCISDKFAPYAAEDEIHGTEQCMENNIYHWQVEAMRYLITKGMRRKTTKSALHEGKNSQRSGTPGRLVINIEKRLVGLVSRVHSIYTDTDRQH